MPRRAVLIHNPQAAAGKARGAVVARTIADLRAAGWEVATRGTAAAGHAVELAAGAAEQGAELVVAAGGDGTVNEVVSGVLRAGPFAGAVGVLPVGTGNDVAKLLGTPDAAALLTAVSAGSRRVWDVLAVDTGTGADRERRHALLYAAVGFAAELLRATTPRVKRWFGPDLCYSVGFFRALRRHRNPRLQVRSDAITCDESLLVALAGNCAQAGGGLMKVAPGAEPDDGLMNVSLIRAAGRLEVAGQFLRLLQGRHIRHPKVRYFPARWLEIAATPAQTVAVDGELIGPTPVRLGVLPRAVTFVATPGRVTPAA
jgi:diacylglycerol kinase (ATP)